MFPSQGKSRENFDVELASSDMSKDKGDSNKHSLRNCLGEISLKHRQIRKNDISYCEWIVRTVWTLKERDKNKTRH